MAIANIITPILNAYRKDEIDAATLRTLTMATPRQQKAWWVKLKGEDGYAPTGIALKRWLFGGSEVPVSNALFDLDAYDGAIIADLFGEERYFADSDKFWERQNEVIADRRQAYLDAGWGNVIVLDIGQHFSAWGYRKVTKRKGGKVFISLTHDGEVTFHEGYLTHKEAERAEKKAKAEAAAPEMAKPERPERTAAQRNYLGLHRHAAVRTELLRHPHIALRLAVAHMIAGSPLWRVEAERQRPDSPTIGESLSGSKAAATFADERKVVRLLLAQSVETESDADGIAGQRHDDSALERILANLLRFDDEDVLRILAFIMAETLAAHSPVIDTLGELLGTSMQGWWTPDQAFFDLLRDKEAINAMLREVAGDVTANAHVASTAKVQKKIIADCLAGDGRTKVEGWLPRYMAFPAQGYTDRFAGNVEAQRRDTVVNDSDADLESMAA